MLKSKKGFTLIELVMVIVILGILAAVAIPKYIDLTTEAQASANSAYIGALRSAISMQYAKETLTPAGGIGVIGPTATATIAQIQALVASPAPPATVLVVTAGACGTGKLVGNGKIPNTAPKSITWTLTCGAAGAPLTLDPGADVGY